jgi:ABC-2 type transport system permease protein
MSAPIPTPAPTPPRTPTPTPRLRRELGLVGWQVLYEQRAFWRNRARAFFSFLFPLMFLVIFGSLFSGKHLRSAPGIPYNVYFVPGILAYGVITTTFVNMAISTSILRDEGVLKRMQGTPLPSAYYSVARICSTALIVVAMTTLTLLLGALAYEVKVRSETLPGMLLALALGSACFTALGMGIVRYIRNAEAAPPVANIAILPLTFISGVFYPTEELPTTLRRIASVFPIHALADALQYAFDPRTRGAGINGDDLLTISIWLAIGALLMRSFLRHPEGGRA